MTGLRIGTIWGIPIRLHASWFLIFGMLTWSLSREYYVNEYPGMNTSIYLLLGVITSLLFFASVLAHELGHSWVALRYGIPVRGINLLIFGGVAQIERDPHSPLAEFLIAIAGPLTSLLLGGFFGLVFLGMRAYPALEAISRYLLRINLMLAAFNLIPGFPLDGGRVLRATVWAINHNYVKATHIAATIGQIIAFIFIGGGIVLMFLGQFSNGVWMMLIGWFLQNAAATANQQVNIEINLRSTTVGQAMNRQLIKLPGLTPLNRVIEEFLLKQAEPTIYVLEYGEVAGMLTPREIQKIPRPHWRFTTINQAMLPFNWLSRLSPEMDLLSALKQMEETKSTALPVFAGGELVGTLTRSMIIHLLHL